MNTELETHIARELCCPEEQFENGVFTLKTHQSNVRSAPEKFEKVTITGHFESVSIEEDLGRETHNYRNVFVFEKLSFRNVFHPHENEKPALSNSSGLKSVFEKLRFRDGLVWTVGLTVEIKMHFQIFPA